MQWSAQLHDDNDGEKYSFSFLKMEVNYIQTQKRDGFVLFLPNSLEMKATHPPPIITCFDLKKHPVRKLNTKNQTHTHSLRLILFHTIRAIVSLWSSSSEIADCPLITTFSSSSGVVKVITKATTIFALTIKTYSLQVVIFTTERAL